MARTLIEIDRDATAPLYRQIRQALERGIVAGNFDTEHRLPSSREIAQDLGVSRNTVNLAYQELIAEGFIESRERLGLFVNRELRPSTIPASRTARQGYIDWDQRVRHFPDIALAHVDKPPDWFNFPYPFLAGQVDARAFPSRAWLRCLREAMFAPHLQHSLQDSLSSDDPLLVEMICSRLLPARGIEAEPDEVLVTIGSQQGLDLLGRLLLNSGSRVAIENPGYLDARHIFLRCNAILRELPVDSAGVRPPESLAGIDLIYLTPSHQHPTNATLSIARRLQVLELAAADGAVIVEDDYDSEFRYQGRPTPALKSLDRTGDAVYLGTFSKFLCPGLRLGYLVGPPALVRELRTLRRYTNRHPPGQLQRALALLIRSGDYHRSLRRYRTRLKRKWEATTEAVNTFLPWQTSPPPGGVSLWMTGPDQLDCRVLVERAQQSGILLERGDIYFGGENPPRKHFRIGFAAISLAAIEPGINALGGIVHQILDE